MLPHPLLLLASCLAPLLLPAGGLLLALPRPGGGVRGLMQYFLQTQRALLLQRVRVQSGRGLVEVKVRKHRMIEDLQPEDDCAQVLDRGPVLEAAGRQEDVGPGAGVQLPTLGGGRRGAWRLSAIHFCLCSSDTYLSAYWLY